MCCFLSNVLQVHMIAAFTVSGTVGRRFSHIRATEQKLLLVIQHLTASRMKNACREQRVSIVIFLS